MSDKKRRQAELIQQKVQEDTRKDWVPTINEEVERIKGCNPTVQSNGNNQVENNQLKYSTREKFKQTINKL